MWMLTIGTSFACRFEIEGVFHPFEIFGFRVRRVRSLIDLIQQHPALDFTRGPHCLMGEAAQA
jgi:hypothetical protein